MESNSGNIVTRISKLALFSSSKVPGSLILQIFDIVAALRDAGITVIGGFHSPMEKECLKILLRGTQPVIVYPARSIKGYRYPKEWKKPIEESRLILLSQFPDKVRRVTAETAEQRNCFIVSLADTIFIPYAANGSRTELLARDIMALTKPHYTINDKANAKLIALGARPLLPGAITSDFGALK